MNKFLSQSWAVSKSQNPRQIHVARDWILVASCDTEGLSCERVCRDNAVCILTRMTMVTENLLGVAALKDVGLSLLGLGMCLLLWRALVANATRLKDQCEDVGM